MTTRIQVRRGTAATWTSVNPVLTSGEWGYETDTGKVKIGDGTTTWVSLPYAVTKTMVGLPNVDNTADVDKPLSNPQRLQVDASLAARAVPYTEGLLLTQRGTSTTQQIVNGLVYATPMDIAVPVKIDQVSFEITTAGSTGSLVRVGIYASDWQNLPGQRIVDAGTVDGTTIRVVDITVATQLPAGKVWLVAVSQGNPTTAPTLRANASSETFADTSATAMATNGRALIAALSYPTGGLPTTLPIVNPLRVTFRAPRFSVRVATDTTKPQPLHVGAAITRAGLPYTVAAAGQEWSTVALPNGVDRFEVRPGDVWYQEVGNNVERAEFDGNANAQPFNTDVWISYAFRITATTINTPWLVAGQFRGTDDAGDYASRSPMFSQSITAGTTAGTFHLEVLTRSDPNATSTGNPASVTRYAADLTLGAWHRFVYKLQFAKTGNGLLAGWIDGTNVIPEAAIPLGYNDTLGPGWKYGAYRAAGSVYPVVIEYANLELGTASLSARVTTPLALPADYVPAIETLPGFSASFASTDTNIPVVVQQALNLKAPLTSPGLLGSPTAPTAAPGDNSTQIATTAFVSAAFPVAAQPGLIQPTAGAANLTALAWPTAQHATCNRFQLAQTTYTRYACFRVAVASGNIQVGVVQLSGANHLTYTRVMNSGVITCPTAGDVILDLGATTLAPGDYAAFIWCDNTTAQFYWANVTGNSGARSTLLITPGASGVAASGTAAFTARTISGLTLQGDF